MSLHPRIERLLRGWPWCLALAMASLYAVTLGLNYGTDNHPVYLLQALRLLKPGILKHDWYASEALQYHPVFSYLAAPLLRVSAKGWGIGIALTVAAAVGSTGWYATMTRLVKNHWLALPAFAAVLALMAATTTQSVAISYIFNQAFQPSTLGSVGLLLALLPFSTGRWLWSGIFVAFSGLFHANYLVLNVLVFGLVHLFMGGGVRAMCWRLLLQLGPSVVPLALLAVPMLATAGGPEAAEAQRILFQIRAPHHYVPRSFQRDLIYLLGWFALGLSASVALPSSRALQRLRLWMLACALVISVLTLATSWSYVPRIAQLFVWRLSPFLDLVGQSLFCLAVVRTAWTVRGWRALSTERWGILLVSALGLASGYALRDLPMVCATVLALLVLGALGVAGSRLGLARMRLKWARRLLPAAVGVGALAIGAWQLRPGLTHLRENSSLLSGLPPLDVDLYAWARNNTTPETGFLTPPQDPAFRYFAERPIVVDWKSSPMVPKDVVEWFRRLKAVTGKPGFASVRDMDGYNALTPARVRTLRAEFGFDYLVVYSSASRSLDEFKLAYKNAAYRVYDLR